MGIGPSSKETTLHHFRDPLIEVISRDDEIDFMGIVVEGTPENDSHKQFVAQRAGVMAETMRADGVIVSIDSWGNSHIDFSAVIQAIGERGIPVVGVSFVGNQASFVVKNQYMDTIIDINKNEAGIETTVVGENNTLEADAVKALWILKNKMKKKNPDQGLVEMSETVLRLLTIRSYMINRVVFSDQTEIEKNTLFLKRDVADGIAARYKEIEHIKVNIIEPDQRDVYINSILDISPIATKVFGKTGEGITHALTGVSVLLTGCETGGFQAANIGSSEGRLQEKIVFGRRGTPAESDVIIHVDVLLKNGHARTQEGITAAHMACDEMVDKIRRCLREMNSSYAAEKNTYRDLKRNGVNRVLLLKLISGLGCMYDTGLFPDAPGGCIGCRSIMALANMQVCISPNEYRDGAVHSMS